MRRERRITARRNDGRRPAWIALLLAAILLLAPAVAVAAPSPHESGLDGPCSMPGDNPAGLTMICAMAGGCVILPVVGPLPDPVGPESAVKTAALAAREVGWNQPPEPPPPRLGLA